MDANQAVKQVFLVGVDSTEYVPIGDGFLVRRLGSTTNFQLSHEKQDLDMLVPRTSVGPLAKFFTALARRVDEQEKAGDAPKKLTDHGNTQTK